MLVVRERFLLGAVNLAQSALSSSFGFFSLREFFLYFLSRFVTFPFSKQVLKGDRSLRV